MKPFFKELFEYSCHFNQKLIEIQVANGHETPEKTVKLLSHILNAHTIWNSRLDETSAGKKVWEINPTEQLSGQNSTNLARSIAIISAQDLERLVTYTNSMGQEYQNTVRDILFHVINHSTHHRAQIVSELKQHGIEPPVSDYIFYKR